MSQSPTKNHYILVSDYQSNQRLTPKKRVTNFEICLMNLENKEVTTMQVTPKSKSIIYKYFGITKKQIDEQYSTRPVIWHINESDAINYIKFLIGDFNINEPLSLKAEPINNMEMYCMLGMTAQAIQRPYKYFLGNFKQSGKDIVQITMTQEIMSKIGSITETLHRFLIGQPNDLVDIYRFHDKTSWEETKDCQVLKQLKTVCKELSDKYPSVRNKHDKDNILYNFYRTILEQRTGEWGESVYGGEPVHFNNKIIIKKIY